MPLPKINKTTTGAGVILGAGVAIGATLAAIPMLAGAANSVAANPILPWMYKVNADSRKLEKLDRIIDNTTPEPDQSITPEQVKNQVYRDLILNKEVVKNKKRSPWSPLKDDETL